MQKIIIGCLLGICITFATPLLIFFHYLRRDAASNTAFLSTRPLVFDLPRDAKAAQTEMRARLASEFRIGADAAGLRDYLSAQGFYLRPDPNTKQAYIATLSRIGNLDYLARRDWSVTWQEDGRGRLVSFDALQSVQWS